MSLRVAFYSHNGFGLGHVARNAKLGQALLRRKPNADVLVITGSAGLHELPLAPNVDYIKLPSVRKQATGRWRPQALDIEMEHLLSLRRTIILESIRSYRPHLFVADFLPLGVERELEPALEELAARTDACSVIGFRDILDEPQVVRASWEADGSPAALDQLYDRVLVYGDPSWFDFVKYGLPPDRTRYVGFLGDPEAVPRPQTAETRILATTGGGADGYPVLAAVLDSIAALYGDGVSSITTTALAGPLMSESDYERLRAISKRTGGRVRRFVDEFSRVVARASVVVSMCGYNSVCDILSYRRPAVVVPRPGPSMEQQMRAAILAQRGLATSLALAECTVEALVGALAAQLERTDYPLDQLPPLDGAERAVDALLELVE